MQDEPQTKATPIFGWQKLIEDTFHLDRIFFNGEPQPARKSTNMSINCQTGKVEDHTA
jgi:hypothetical protein